MAGCMNREEMLNGPRKAKERAYPRELSERSSDADAAARIDCVRAPGSYFAMGITTDSCGGCALAISELDRFIELL